MNHLVPSLHQDHISFSTCHLPHLQPWGHHIILIHITLIPITMDTLLLPQHPSKAHLLQAAPLQLKGLLQIHLDLHILL